MTCFMMIPMLLVLFQIAFSIGQDSSVWIPPPEHATERDALQLHEKLLGNYSRHLRPVANQSAPVDVKLDFNLLSIFDVDEVKQQISVMALIKVQWHDKNLVWNPHDYGGIDRMFFDEKQIWVPNIYVESGHNSVHVFDLPTQHYVRYDGTVTYVSVGNMGSPCSLDLSVFPYDSQACTFGFGVLDSSVKEVNLNPGDQGAGKAHGYVEDGEWNVLETITSVITRPVCDVKFGTVHVILKIRRRSTFYVVNIIIPAVVIAMLSLLTFGVPVESGERLAYALTILLSLSVYITYIGSFMPMASVNMPIIFYFLLGLFMISCMCVVMTVMVIAIRWSHVVLVEGHQKTILIFGVPFKIKRRQLRRHSFGFACCLEDDAEYDDDNDDNVSSPDSDIWSSDKHGLWDADKDGGHSNGRKNSVVPPVRVGSEGHHIAIPTSPTFNEKEQLRLAFAKQERRRSSVLDVQNPSGHDVKADPDVMYICSRLNMYSFVTLLVAFFGMTSVTFLQFHYQMF